MLVWLHAHEAEGDFQAMTRVCSADSSLLVLDAVALPKPEMEKTRARQQARRGADPVPAGGCRTAPPRHRK